MTPSPFRLESSDSSARVPGWKFWVLAAAVVGLQLLWRSLVGDAGMSWIASPLLAFLVCLAAWRRDHWVLLPVGAAVLVLQPLLNASHGFAPSLAGLALAIPCYACLWLAGRLVRRAGQAGRLPGLGATLAAGLGGAFGFYLLSNSLAWVGSTDYPQTPAGWWQAQTVGVPGFAPSWTFLRALVVGQLVFVPLLLAAVRLFGLGQKIRGSETKPGVALATGTR